LRPGVFASDQSKAIDTYIYTIKELENREQKKIESFIVLLPTTPLRSVVSIDCAIEVFENNSADSVISVTLSDHPIHWFKTINSEGLIESYSEEKANENRQEYDKYYVPNGAIYIFRFERLINDLNYYMTKTYPYVMSKYESVDIDTIEDFEYAEYLINKAKQSND
jgi:N-acylneuraminate cytidylyltransferase/CMP-N,N'-diacetyllegionaminic acid synthase